MKYNRLTTGEKYTLFSLFSNDNVVIIPDLQRDYCWGTKTNDRELVRDFVRNIVNNGLKNDSDLSLGLLYGYEAPIGHIQLCDGQQRITTLFLLLGLLNKKSENKFQNQLISIFELKEDDREPYLQYSIRESSLYFLSDLVCKFFIAENDLNVCDINSHLNWYFKDYDLDPSIQSMLEALIIIEEEIKDVDALQFGKYLINRLSFMYYDMGTRANGEETFVVINTTGEPLTTTENLKPLFIDVQETDKDKENCSQKWEEWETWFWKNRTGSGDKTNDTADNGFREFLRWITLLKTKDKDSFNKIQETGYFDFDTKIEVSEIDDYFNVVKFLFEESTLFNTKLDWLAPEKKDKNRNTQITWFQLLPVIEYIKRFGKEDLRNVLRVKTFFENLSRTDSVSKNIGQLLLVVIETINYMVSEDIAEIINITNVSRQIITDEEKLKFTIYIENKKSRIIIEDAFWLAESHKIWRGEIASMLNWSTTNKIFDFDLFKEFDRVFCYLFHDTLEYSELDVTRRALLTRDLANYPRKFKGNTNTSFCWEYTDWQVLINDNEVQFGMFLNELISTSNIDSKLQSMINNNFPDKDFDEFVKIPELLEYCTKKNIQYSDKNGWLLVKGQKTSGEYAILKFYRMYLEILSTPFWDKNVWKIDFWGVRGSCIFFDNGQENIAIDLTFIDDNNFKVEVFRRGLESDIIKNDLLFLEEYLNWNGERYQANFINIENSIELIKKIQHFDFKKMMNPLLLN